MMLDTVEVDPSLRAAYESAATNSHLPERRLVERLVFPTTPRPRPRGHGSGRGETDFETLVADRGLDLADIDMGEVTRADLGPPPSVSSTPGQGMWSGRYPPIWARRCFV